MPAAAFGSKEAACLPEALGAGDVKKGQFPNEPGAPPLVFAGDVSLIAPRMLHSGKKKKKAQFSLRPRLEPLEIAYDYCQSVTQHVRLHKETIREAFLKVPMHGN
jgi:hypothetical protein